MLHGLPHHLHTSSDIGDVGQDDEGSVVDDNGHDGDDDDDDDDDDDGDPEDADVNVVADFDDD